MDTGSGREIFTFVANRLRADDPPGHQVWSNRVVAGFPAAEDHVRVFRIRLGALLAAALIALAGTGTLMVAPPPRPALALTNCSVSGDSLDAQETAFLALINDYRAENGRSALKVSPALNKALSLIHI